MRVGAIVGIIHPFALSVASKASEAGADSLRLRPLWAYAQGERLLIPWRLHTGCNLYNRASLPLEVPMTNPRVAELVELLRLERLEDNLFRGASRDIGTRNVFGGQVLGQALSTNRRR